MQAHEKGVSLKDAAKGAIGPSLGAMARQFANRNAHQSGGSSSSALFSGENGIPHNVTTVYKRKRKALEKKGSGIKKKKSKVRFDTHGATDTYNF